MNICMTHYAFYPTTGGVESHLLDLCAELVRQKHEVYALVGSLEGQPQQSEFEGIHVYREDLMNPEWIRSEKERKGLSAEQEDPELREGVRQMYARFFAEHNIDVVHGHNFHHFVPEHALALTTFYEQGMANVLTVHEVWSEFICKDLLNRAKWDYIINFCNHVLEGIRAQAPDLNNLELVYPGIDVGLFSPANKERKWADKLGLEGRPVIIHPARMLPWKGVIYSIQAVDIIRRTHPDVLLIVTDTDDIVDWIRELRGYKEEVLRMIDSLGLKDNVYTQPFPYIELPWVYNFCDAVVYPTIEEEPFGLVPVEAMACAKPVVVTRSGGMVESVVDGETGYIIPKRDSEALAERLLRILEDPGLAERLGSNGRERATKQFSRERMARETVALYKRACADAEARKIANTVAAAPVS